MRMTGTILYHPGGRRPERSYPARHYREQPVAGDVQAVIGVPIHEDVVHLRAALESLLAQDHPAFAVLVADDSRSDQPGEIVREYERADPRLRYERNPARLGLIGNWRHVFLRAREVHPEAAFFAWGSDHDLWEPGWLSALARELEAHPAAVLAYPYDDVVDGGGQQLQGPWSFDTAGDRRGVRFVRTLRRMVAGDMVYGLYRAETLERCGALRDVVLPDRLLLAELSLAGEFRQVPELLWHRRRLDRPARSAAETLFAGRPPRSARLPWSLAHAAELRRARGAGAAMLYAVLAPVLDLARRGYYAAGGSPRGRRPENL
jgi:glycosyltransferase involved in cell wall biosynthesis